MKTHFPAELDHTWSKFVIPYSIVPATHAIEGMSEAELQDWFKKLGKTAVWFPDKDFGLGLDNMERLTVWRAKGKFKAGADHDEEFQVMMLSLIRSSMLLVQCENVRKLRVVPTWRDRTPLPPHESNVFHVVHLGPGEIQTDRDLADYTDRCSRMKRLHSVRAHYRRLASGKIVLISQHLRGRKSAGVVDKEVCV